MSPAQIDKKLARKVKKKELRESEASKRGRRNRSTGYRSEKYMLQRYDKWGIPCKRQPGSGKFKGSLGSDFQVTILDKVRLQEDKTRQGAVAQFKRVEDKAIMYGDYCVIMNETAWKNLILHGELPEYEERPDKRIEGIKKFFSQDDAEIVSIRLPGGRECIFAIRLSLWKEFAYLNKVEELKDAKND